MIGTDHLRLAPRIAAVLAVAACALTVLPSASAAESCGWKVIREYLNETIRTTHSVACYREALKVAPLDLLLYSDFKDELARARRIATGGADEPGVVIEPAPPPAAPPPAATPPVQDVDLVQEPPPGEPPPATPPPAAPPPTPPPPTAPPPATPPPPALPTEPAPAPAAPPPPTDPGAQPQAVGPLDPIPTRAGPSALVLFAIIASLLAIAGLAALLWTWMQHVGTTPIPPRRPPEHGSEREPD